METLTIANDLQVFGTLVTSFPLGVGEAFAQIMKMVPDGDKRSCYGISSMNENGEVRYFAAIEELHPGEAESYQCERTTVPNGEYLAVTVYDWQQKTHCIKNVFHTMMQDERFTHDAPCVEWYKNDREMVCLLQINPVKDMLYKISDAFKELENLAAPLDEQELNRVPFTRSWTAAQVITHITKSVKAMAQAMEMRGKPAAGDITARVQELKDMFLDFSVKYVSPEFIVPPDKRYTTTEIAAGLETSGRQLLKNAATANAGEMISLPGFGEITKMELLHFVLYHTQRHVHQLKNILPHLKHSM
jgi:DinB superfamily